MDSVTLDLLARESQGIAAQAAAAANAGPSTADRAEFERLVTQVGQHAETAFRVSCLLARNSTGVEETAAIWRRMIALCDSVLATIRNLAHQHPHSFEAGVYDHILDFRSEAQERFNLHS